VFRYTTCALTRMRCVSCRIDRIFLALAVIIAEIPHRNCVCAHARVCTCVARVRKMKVSILKCGAALEVAFAILASHRANRTRVLAFISRLILNSLTLAGDRSNVDFNTSEPTLIPTRCLTNRAHQWIPCRPFRIMASAAMRACKCLR